MINISLHYFCKVMWDYSLNTCVFKYWITLMLLDWISKRFLKVRMNFGGNDVKYINHFLQIFWNDVTLLFGFMGSIVFRFCYCCWTFKHDLLCHSCFFFYLHLVHFLWHLYLPFACQLPSHSLFLLNIFPINSTMGLVPSFILHCLQLQISVAKLQAFSLSLLIKTPCPVLLLNAI